MTKVPRSNGWDNDTAALQLFSHLEGDALNVTHLVGGTIVTLWISRTIRTTREDPENFATALEMLAVMAFGDMGLRLIRDRFIAGHSNCDLRRHLHSAPPETPIRDVVDRCRVWESHADPAVHRMSKPTPDPMYPTYTVCETDSNNEITRVATVTGLKSDQNQLMDVIRRVVSNTERPNPKHEIQDITGRLKQLLREPVPKTLEQMLRSLFDGQRQRQRQPPRLQQQRRDWTDVVCFSCGRLGHTATCCPDFNGAFPFLQPGWRTEKTSGGITMIPPQAITDRRRAENDG